jgi:hypothetical protein
VKHLKKLGYPGFPPNIFATPAREGNTEMVGKIVEMGATVGYYVQYWREEGREKKPGGYAKVLGELVNRGLDLKVHGPEILFDAIMQNDAETVKELVRLEPGLIKARIQTIGSVMTPMFCGNSAKMKVLLVSLGFDPQARNQDGATPLHYMINSEFPLSTSDIYVRISPIISCV